MSEGRGFVRPLVSAVLVAASVAGLLNVYGAGEVQALATPLVCPEPGCEARLTRLERTPLGHTYVFALAPSNEVEVRCARSLVLVGGWRCEKR